GGVDLFPGATVVLPRVVQSDTLLVCSAKEDHHASLRVVGHHMGLAPHQGTLPLGPDGELHGATAAAPIVTLKAAVVAVLPSGEIHVAVAAGLVGLTIVKTIVAGIGVAVVAHFA